jgi:hypothetical protein
MPRFVQPRDHEAGTIKESLKKFLHEAVVDIVQALKDLARYFS